MKMMKFTLGMFSLFFAIVGTLVCLFNFIENETSRMICVLIFYIFLIIGHYKQRKNFKDLVSIVLVSLKMSYEFKTVILIISIGLCIINICLFLPLHIFNVSIEIFIGTFIYSIFFTLMTCYNLIILRDTKIANLGSGIQFGDFSKKDT